MISVVVIDYKSPLFTERCIKSLEKTTYKDKEIILIDNTFNNIGLAAAQNLGATRAKGEYLFFLNNDTLVKEDIFERLLESDADIVGCKMYDYCGQRELASGISVDKFGCPAGDTGAIFYPDGAIFMKKKTFWDIGGFDEKLFLYGEDRDLCWRAWLAGYNIDINNRAIFFHNSSCVTNVSNYKRRKISERNIIRSMIKNYLAWNLPKVLLQYIFWSILELGLIAVTNPQAIWKSYLPAYWWNVQNLHNTLSERKKIVHRVPDKFIPFSKKIGKLHTLKTKGVPRWAKF